MSEEKIDNFVDLLFNFDMQELENETKFLENYKKLQQEKRQLEERVKTLKDTQLKQLNIIQKRDEIIDKANNELIVLIQIIMEQPSKDAVDDLWLLNRLESISTILNKGVNE